MFLILFLLFLHFLVKPVFIIKTDLLPIFVFCSTLSETAFMSVDELTYILLIQFGSIFLFHLFLSRFVQNETLNVTQSYMASVLSDIINHSVYVFNWFLHFPSDLLEILRNENYQDILIMQFHYILYFRIIVLSVFLNHFFYSVYEVLNHHLLITDFIIISVMHIDQEVHF